MYMYMDCSILAGYTLYHNMIVHIQMVCADHAYILLSPQKIAKPLSIVGKKQLQKLRRLRSR